MPSAGQLRVAARDGKVEEVRTLLNARANIEEKSVVSEATGTSVAAGFLGVLSYLWMLLESVLCRTVHAAAPTEHFSHSKLGRFAFS